jgi:hypothetical protein
MVGPNKARRYPLAGNTVRETTNPKIHKAGVLLPWIAEKCNEVKIVLGSNPESEVSSFLCASLCCSVSWYEREHERERERERKWEGKNCLGSNLQSGLWDQLRSKNYCHLCTILDVLLWCQRQLWNYFCIFKPVAELIWDSFHLPMLVSIWLPTWILSLSKPCRFCQLRTEIFCG